MGDSDQKPAGFTVNDRRIFAGEAEAPSPEAPQAAGTTDAVRTTEAGKGEPAAAPLPPVDFPTFVLSLGSSALMHLGEIERPQTGKVAQDLGMAKHTIDLLSMLQEKTKGNLTAHEAQLLESLLFDLRLRYVSAAKAGGR